VREIVQKAAADTAAYQMNADSFRIDVFVVFQIYGIVTSLRNEIQKRKRTVKIKK